jgi:hypothetical protein
MGLLFLLYLGNYITTISVLQASSPITIKFDTCLAIPCGYLKNQHYIQGLEIYICMWRSAPYPHSYRDNGTSQCNNPPCASWSAEWWTALKGECCTGGFMVL